MMVKMRWTVVMVVVVSIVIEVPSTERGRLLPAFGSATRTRTALVIAAKVPATPQRHALAAAKSRFWTPTTSFRLAHLRGQEAPHPLLPLVSPRSPINCDAINISIR
jgi:hypothetical protein